MSGQGRRKWNLRNNRFRIFYFQIFKLFFEWMKAYVAVSSILIFQYATELLRLMTLTGPNLLQRIAVQRRFFCVFHVHHGQEQSRHKSFREIHDNFRSQIYHRNGNARCFNWYKLNCFCCSRKAPLILLFQCFFSKSLIKITFKKIFIAILIICMSRILFATTQL